MALKSPRRGVQSIRRYYSAALGSFPSRSFYVDATLGNDANSGTHPDEAWQTVAKVRGVHFLPGDHILFKRGETWNGTILFPQTSGEPGKYITFGAYGSGNKPRIAAPGESVTIHTNDQDYLIFEDLWIDVPWDGVDTGQGIRIDGGSQGVTIRRCTVIGDQDENTVGIHILGVNFLVDSNDVSHVQWGIELNSNNNALVGVVSYNTIHDIDMGDVDDCDGIKPWRGGGAGNDFSGVVVSHNDISGFQEHGIDAKEAAYLTIEYNHIYDNGVLYPDITGGIVAGEGADGIGIVVRYNLIENLIGNAGEGISLGSDDGEAYYNIIDTASKNGITVWNGTTGTVVYNNTVLNAPTAGLYVQDTPCAARNNIFDSDTDDILANGAVSVITGGWNLLRNDAAPNLNGGATYTGGGNDIVIDEPEFVNEGGGDFHLAVGSPCRDAGTDVGLTKDYDGVTVPQETNPAIGAYEYVP